MKFPSKVTSYSESILPKMLAVIKVLNDGDISPRSLYKKTTKEVGDINDFLEVLDCLYAIGEIALDEGRGMIYKC